MSGACFPWRAPPPNMYRLKAVLGYRNHDFTKKRAPAWSFVRYVAPPQPKPVVSLSPFQKKMMRKPHGKKKKAPKWGSRIEFDTDTSSSRMYSHQKHSKWKRGKNKKRRQQGDESSGRKFEKSSEPASSSKDKSKKLASKKSTDSGQFNIAPDDMCDLCFPWAKPKAPPSESESKSAKKTKRSRSIISNIVVEDPVQDGHSFLVMHPGKLLEEVVCDPHSGLIFPPGKKIELERPLPKLPGPPKEESQLINKEKYHLKFSTKSTAPSYTATKKSF